MKKKSKAVDFLSQLSAMNASNPPSEGEETSSVGMIIDVELAAIWEVIGVLVNRIEQLEANANLDSSMDANVSPSKTTKVNLSDKIRQVIGEQGVVGYEVRKDD